MKDSIQLLLIKYMGPKANLIYHKYDSNDMDKVKNEMVERKDWNKFLEYCYSSSEVLGEMMCNDGDDYYYNHEFISCIMTPNNFFYLLVKWLSEKEKTIQVYSKREYMDFLEEVAEKYIRTSKKSMLRNKHMNELIGDEYIPQKFIDAAIVDFINTVGLAHGLDEGYSVDYLHNRVKDKTKHGTNKKRVS